MAKTHDGAEQHKQTLEALVEHQREAPTPNNVNAAERSRVTQGHFQPEPEDADAPSPKATAQSYIELSSQAYTLLVDTYAAASRRRLDYVKSLFEVVVRPYASTAVEHTVRENFDRAGEILSLSVAELQSSVQKRAEFSESWLKHAAKLQDAALEASRGLYRTSVSNLEFARDSSSAQLNAIAQRLDEAQDRVAASVRS
jgi:hypothetical protein